MPNIPKISSDKIIQEIEKRQVVPIPRWHFILKHIVFWLLAVVSVITGAISMATAVYVFIDNDYVTDYANIEKLFAQRPVVEIIVQSIPYVWLIAMALFIVASYYGLRNTRKGYRYPTLRVMAGSLAMSSLLCLAMQGFDIGKYIHRYLIENVSGYSRLINTNEILWAKMEKGLLGGKLVSHADRDSVVVIKDYRGHFWTVDISGAKIYPGVKFEIEKKYLKVTGFKTGPESFKAETIRPWHK